MRAYLKIDGVESEIQNLDYSLSRDVSPKGEITTRVKRVGLSITKESKYNKGAMLKWMSKQDQKKEGEVIIYEDDEKKTEFKTIKFKEAKISDYSESFDREDSLMYETFTIYGELISVNDAEFDMQWRSSSL